MSKHSTHELLNHAKKQSYFDLSFLSSNILLNSASSYKQAVLHHSYEEEYEITPHFSHNYYTLLHSRKVGISQ